MKKLFILLLLILCVPNVRALEMETSAKSAILIDQNTGTILYQKNEHERRPMASMTKIMSLLLFMEKIEDGTLSLDDDVVISPEASSMGGSQVFLQTGEKYKVNELIKSVAMASANDVGVIKKQSQVMGEEIII